MRWDGNPYQHSNKIQLKYQFTQQVDTTLGPVNWGVVYNKSNHKIPSMKDPFYYKMIRKIPRSTLNMKSPLKVECGYSLD